MPNPAEEDYYYKPPAEVVLNGNIAGIRYGVSV